MEPTKKEKKSVSVGGRAGVLWLTVSLWVTDTEQKRVTMGGQFMGGQLPRQKNKKNKYGCMIAKPSHFRIIRLDENLCVARNFASLVLIKGQRQMYGYRYK